MGNASDAMKQVADYVTSGVDDDGIARFGLPLFFFTKP